MKLTQVLLAGAVAFVASNAMAYDIAHPFWGPAQGQFASETDYHYNRVDGNRDNNMYQQGVFEKVSYGITNDWTVAVKGAKNWMKQNNNGNNNKDNVWGLSTTYNVINDGQRFAQVGLAYTQDKWDSDNMMKDDDTMIKSYELTFKGGVNMGSITPYAEAWIGDTLNHGKYNDAHYALRVAVDTELTKQASADVGLKYYRRTSDYGGIYDYPAGQSYTLDAAVSYLFTKNVVGKVYGSFLLHQYEAGDERAQRSNTIGANVKVAF